MFWKCSVTDSGKTLEGIGYRELTLFIFSVIFPFTTRLLTFLCWTNEGSFASNSTSYQAHQLNTILDESSFNSMSDMMVFEHIDYPTCSYYMKNQHCNVTYNAMLDIHLYHPMLNCRMI